MSQTKEDLVAYVNMAPETYSLMAVSLSWCLFDLSIPHYRSRPILRVFTLNYRDGVLTSLVGNVEGG